MLPLAALVALAACDRRADASAADSTTAKPLATSAGARDGGATAAVRTASRPADACGWISAAEVAKIVGPLSGTPRKTDDGCLYPLPVDTETARRRTQALEFKRMYAGHEAEPLLRRAKTFELAFTTPERKALVQAEELLNKR